MACSAHARHSLTQLSLLHSFLDPQGLSLTQWPWSLAWPDLCRQDPKLQAMDWDLVARPVLWAWPYPSACPQCPFTHVGTKPTCLLWMHSPPPCALGELHAVLSLFTSVGPFRPSLKMPALQTWAETALLFFCNCFLSPFPASKPLPTSPSVGFTCLCACSSASLPWEMRGTLGLVS